MTPTATDMALAKPRFSFSVFLPVELAAMPSAPAAIRPAPILVRVPEDAGSKKLLSILFSSREEEWGE